jgi:hypothetical protein
MRLIDPSPELLGSIERRGLTNTLLTPDPVAAITHMWPRPRQLRHVVEPVD